MATKAKNKLTPEQPLPVAPRSDLAEFAERIAENPMLYVGAVLFVIVAGISGWLISVFRATANQEFATAYARAMEPEERTEVLSALEPLAETNAGPSHEALYMLGETAYAANEMDKATEAFTTLREKHPDSPFVPDAVEGLGFVAESEGRFVDAKGLYQSVIDNWPESFAAKRQQFNIGRCEEAIGNPEAAIEAYRAQTLAFPNSRVAARANSMMAQIQQELGPEETETTSDLESALGAVLDAPVTDGDGEAVVSEPSAEPETGETDAAVPTETPQLELTLPAPGAGQGVSETEPEATTTP